MARTKQTARKSHGGAAPRKTLLAQVGSQNSQSAPLPVALPVGLARASGGSNVLPGKSLDITTRSKSKKTELAVVSKSDEQTHWCTVCHNGGMLLLCHNCKRGVCFDACLPTNISAITQGSGKFTCPDCWRRDKNTKGSPYIGLSSIKHPLILRGKANSRSTLTLLDPTPIAVISIRLDGLDHEGDPSFLVYNYLKPYYPPGTKQSTYISLCYNIPDDDGGAGLARYEGDVGRAIAKLSGFTRFLVFVTTHSTPEDGLLWNVPEGKGAVTGPELLGAVLPPCLLSVIKADLNASLFLLTCGAIHTNPESRKQLSSFSANHFASVWGFTAPDFHPNLASIFLQKFVSAFYIKLRPALLDNLLRDSVELGMHSGLIVYLPQGVYEYIWSHPSARPFGVVLPLSCEGCGRLESWAIPQIETSSLPTVREFLCASCGNSFQSYIPALYRVGAKSRDASGEWFFRQLEGLEVKSLKWSYSPDGVLSSGKLL